MSSQTEVPKLDLKKQYKTLYSPSARKVEVVDVPELQFTMIDGRIEPGVPPAESESFRNAMGATYAVGYGLKFMSKLRDEDPLDFTVMATEGLWSTESGDFPPEGEEPLLFTLMMLQPEHIDHTMFETAVSQARAKADNPALAQLRLERWREGLSLQIMHIGPYATEQATIDKMDEFAEEHRYTRRGRHHEIYLGDPTRAKPENLRTILRHPVARRS